MTQEGSGNTPQDAGPPIGRTWRRLYTAVLLALAAEVALFFWVTRAFQ